MKRLRIKRKSRALLAAILSVATSLPAGAAELARFTASQGAAFAALPVAPAPLAPPQIPSTMALPAAGVAAPLEELPTPAAIPDDADSPGPEERVVNPGRSFAVDHDRRSVEQVPATTESGAAIFDGADGEAASNDAGFQTSLVLAANGDKSEKKKLSKALKRAESPASFMPLIRALSSREPRVAEVARNVLSGQSNLPTAVLIALIAVPAPSDEKLDKAVLSILRAQKKMADPVWGVFLARLRSPGMGGRFLRMLGSLAAQQSRTLPAGLVGAIVDLALSKEDPFSREALEILPSVCRFMTLDGALQVRMLSRAGLFSGTSRRRIVADILSDQRDYSEEAWRIVASGLRDRAAASVYTALLKKRANNLRYIFAEPVLTILAGMIGGRDQRLSFDAVEILRLVATKSPLSERAQKALFEMGNAHPALWPRVSSVLVRQATLGPSSWDLIKAGLASTNDEERYASFLVERASTFQDFPEPILNRLAEIVVEAKAHPARQTARVALLDVSQRLPEKTQILLFSTRRNPSDSRWGDAAAILVGQEELAPLFWEQAAEDLAAGGGRAGAVTRLIGFSKAREMPKPFVAAWVEFLRSMPDADARRELLRSLEPRLSALDLLDIASPESVERAVDLIPDLAIMKGEGFSESALRDPRSLAELLDILRIERTQSGPAIYKRRAAEFTAIDDIEARVFALPARDDFEVAAGRRKYRLSYAVPELKGDWVQEPAVLADYKPGAPGDAAVRRSFASLDALIQANFRALAILARGGAGLNRRSASLLMRELEVMIEKLGELSDPSRELKAYRRLRAELAPQWADLPESAALPPELARRLVEHEGPVVDIDKIRNVHTLVNVVHQRGIEAMMDRARSIGGSGLLLLDGGKLRLLNLGGPLVRGRRFVNPLIAMMLKAKNLSRASAIVNDDEAWITLALGCHTAEIHVKYADPDDGGGIEIRYTDSGDNAPGCRARLEYIRLSLLGLGIEAKVKGIFLQASLNKDTGLRSRAAIGEILPRALTLLFNAKDYDFAFARYPSATRRALVKTLAEGFGAEGVVPVEEDKIKQGADAWIKDRRAREALRSPLDSELRRLGLPTIPSDEPIGQRTIDVDFNRPVRRMLAAGTLVLDRRGLPQRGDESWVDGLAVFAAERGEEALRLGAVLRALDPGEFDFTAGGSVGRMRAEMAQRETAGGGLLTVTALRDPDTGAIAFASASAWNGLSRRELDVDGLLAVLAALGIECPAPAPAGRALRDLWIRQLRAAAPTDAANVFHGLAASRGDGPAYGTAVFDKRKAGVGGVLFAPSTSPDDLDAMRRAAAVVTTGGGLLSHAAITTRELGVPSVILNSARWRRSSDETVLEIPVDAARPPRIGRSGLAIADLDPEEFAAVHEGDLVAVDGSQGTVALIGKEEARSFAALRRELSAGSSVSVLSRGLAALFAAATPPAQDWMAGFVIERALSDPSSRRGLLHALARSLDAQAYDVQRSKVSARLAAEAASIEVVARDPRADTGPPARRVDAMAALREAFGVESEDLRRAAAALTRRAESDAAARRESSSAAVLGLASRADSLTEEDLPEMRRVLHEAARATPGAPAVDRALSVIRDLEAALSRRKRERLARLGPVVLPFGAIDDDFTPLTGGKSAKLGEILRVVQGLGYVPEGVALTTEAYFRFLREAGIEKAVESQAKELDRSLARANLDSPRTREAVRRRAEKIRALILSARLDSDSALGRELLAAFQAHGMGDGPFAVRSSAVQEDGADAAFAGAAETFLYVPPDEVLNKIVAGWASFWLERGILYRRQQGVASAALRPAIAVQRMVDSEVAGVMFTVDPASGRRQTVISAAYGQGEAVVSGLVQADHYAADAAGEEILAPVIGDKRIRVQRSADGRGTEMRTVERRLRRKRALTQEQVGRLARIGAALESHFGYPVDVEFAVKDDRIAVLQVRPITTAPERLPAR